MLEHYTDALVLDKKDFNESDSLVYLYTEKLGKVVAKARGLKKILSKSNAHLEPLNFVKVRLATGRNGHLQLIDALSFKKEITKEIKNSPERTQKILRFLNLISEMTGEFQADTRLWQVIKKIMETDYEERQINQGILKMLGFDMQYAECGICRSKEIKYFYKKDHTFLCEQCVSSHRATMATQINTEQFIEIM